MRVNQNNKSIRDNSNRPNFWDNINADEIGQGKFFTEGTYGNRKNIGLKGQLSKLRRDGRFSYTNNLSKKNIDSIYKLISNRLKKHQTSGRAHINRLDKKAILEEAEKLVKTDPKFSRDDKKDVEDIIRAIAEKSKKQSFANERYNKPQSTPENTSNETMLDRDKLNINIDISPTNSNEPKFIETKKDTPNTNDEKPIRINIQEKIEKTDLEIPDTKDINDMPI